MKTYIEPPHNSHPANRTSMKFACCELRGVSVFLLICIIMPVKRINLRPLAGRRLTCKVPEWPAGVVSGSFG